MRISIPDDKVDSVTPEECNIPWKICSCLRSKLVGTHTVVIKKI